MAFFADNHLPSVTSEFAYCAFRYGTPWERNAHKLLAEPSCKEVVDVLAKDIALLDRIHAMRKGIEASREMGRPCLKSGRRQERLLSKNREAIRMGTDVYLT